MFESAVILGNGPLRFDNLFKVKLLIAFEFCARRISGSVRQPERTYSLRETRRKLVKSRRNDAFFDNYLRDFWE